MKNGNSAGLWACGDTSASRLTRRTASSGCQLLAPRRGQKPGCGPGSRGAAATRRVTSGARAASSVAAGLPSIDGFDARGLNHARGKQDFYLKLLRQFVADFQSFGEQARQFIGEGKREEAQRLAHSLKGVAASVGALRVAAAASELELVFRQGEASEPALASVERELRPVMSSLASHFGAEPAATSSPRVADPSEEQLSTLALPEWVNDLRRLLNDGDIAAQQLWEQRGEELKSLLPARTYAHLRRALENFEFEAALKALSRSQGGA